MVVQIYPNEELLQKIKDLDTKIDEAVTRSRVDDSMTESEFQVSIEQMRTQRMMYYNMYINQIGDPSAGNIISMLPAPDWIV